MKPTWADQVQTPNPIPSVEPLSASSAQNLNQQHLETVQETVPTIGKAYIDLFLVISHEY